jgi:polyisoprenoid-binding protein YceI
MGKHTAALTLALCLAALPGLAQEPATGDIAGEYEIDRAHSSVVFSVKHMGITLVYGRFNTFSGDIVFAPENPENNAITMEVETASVDTAIAARDEHLRKDDFFHVEAHPTMTFRSTSCKPLAESTFELTGDFTLMGVTREITFPVTYNGTAVYRDQSIRTGYDCAFTILRSDFKMGPPSGSIADEVHVVIALQAAKKEPDKAEE